MASSSFRSDLTGLNDVVKALSERRVVKVGVFGNKSNRKAGGALTNAELGMIHELGSYSRNIPARSFLRMPLHFQTERILKEAAVGAEKAVAEGKMELVLKRLGTACENAIQRAFATSGFGTWAAQSYKTLLAKTKGSLAVRRQKAAEVIYERGQYAKPLIDTGQLRRSISSKVDNPS